MASLRSRLALPSDTVYLIDGSAFVFRAFYAFQNMTRSDGFPTNILFIVTRLLLRILREEQPEYLGFILDGKGPNFRKEIYAEYKANRSATPENLVKQLEPLLQIIKALGIPCHVSDGCEADDCIASLASRLKAKQKVVIIGADKDLKQCLDANVLLWDPAAKDERITTEASFTEEMGMLPSSWPDYQALVGDSSDNIPGIAKVGPKTAQTLIQQFPTLEELFSRLAAVPPKIRTKLEGQGDNAMLYRNLTRLQIDACPELDKPGLQIQRPSVQQVLGALNSFELRSLVREVESMERAGVWRVKEHTQLQQPSSRQTTSGLSLTDGEAGSAQSGAEPVPDPVRSAQASDMKGKASKSCADSSPVESGNVSTTSPTTGAMVEGSLFGPAVLSAPADATAFLHVDSVQDLPLPHKRVGLLPLEEGLLYAADDMHEVLYTGPAEQLPVHLLSAPAIANGDMQIVTPDVKELLRRDPAFTTLPCESWFDLSLAGYLLSPEDRTYAWEHLASRYSVLSGSKYSATLNPVLLALDIARLMVEQMQGAELTSVFKTIELPLVPVLRAMEVNGITINKPAFADFLHDVQKSLDALTVQIYEHADGPFNIRSSQQLSEVLFGHLQLPKSGKTKGGATTTSQAALEKLIDKHPIVPSLLEYRKLEKLRSTYLEPLPLEADANDRIHTTFNQTATATGRLSSSGPNLQNIPIRGPMGGRMRSCFTASEGKLLVCADYSQVELRVLAHLSGDPTLLESFKNNEDIHSRTASLLFDVAPDQVTPDQRRNAKTINFGLIYGMGAQKLGQDLGISMKEAKEFIERYFSRLTKLKEFYESIEHDAAAHGYVATMTGRRRLTPDITSGNNQLRSQARRQAVNTRIQGSAADIIKIAMIEVFNDAVLKKLEASMLLQVHDELVLEVQSDRAQETGKRLSQLMEGVAPGGKKLDVPLLVDCGVGKTWNDAH